MDSLMQVLSGLLALIALGGSLAIIVVRVVAPHSRWAAYASAVTERRVAFTAAVGLSATLGSLYFSEIAKMTPCRLCWFQRTMMYPIAVIGVIAWIRGRRGREDRHAESRWYFIGLATIGLAISIYHNVLELFPSLESNSCSAVGPACSVVWFRTFGVLSLATMALCGFIAVLVLNTVTFSREQP